MNNYTAAYAENGEFNPIYSGAYPRTIAVKTAFIRGFDDAGEFSVIQISVRNEVYAEKIARTYLSRFPGVGEVTLSFAADERHYQHYSWALILTHLDSPPRRWG